MLKTSSRYYALKDAVFVAPDGTQVLYKQRRFLPLSLQSNAQYAVQSGDRLDLVAANKLGNSQLFWQIADANMAMHPSDLVKTTGRILDIPTPTSYQS
jgi:hypothetical protein